MRPRAIQILTLAAAATDSPICAQFAPPPTIVVTDAEWLVFENGFESGDVSVWSDIAP